MFLFLSFTPQRRDLFLEAVFCFNYLRYPLFDTAVLLVAEDAGKGGVVRDNDHGVIITDTDKLDLLELLQRELSEDSPLPAPVGLALCNNDEVIEEVERNGLCFLCVGDREHRVEVPFLDKPAACRDQRAGEAAQRAVEREHHLTAL